MIRTLLGASAMTTLGALPVFLLSSQSVFVRDELGFDERHFGIAVSAYFLSAALAALLGGRLVDAMGRRNSTTGSGILVAAGAALIAWVAHSWAVLMVGMVVLGVANAGCQVTANLIMARVIPPHRRGLGFGVKQSAIPLSIVLAGLAVPTISALAGWRWTFALTGLGGLVIAVAGLRVPRGTRDGTRPAAPDRPPMTALFVTMTAITLASAAANSLGTFIASWGFQVGLTPGEAGVLMAVGSAVNIIARVISGHLADRRDGRNLPVVAVQMLIGAVALTVISFPSPVTLIPAELVAFGLGWSWPGLLLYAVVRIGRDAPAAASGFIQAGAFAGGAAGPAVFGLLVDSSGYETAWRAAAALFLAAGTLVMVARRIFVADLLTRPPVRPIGRHDE